MTKTAAEMAEAVDEIIDNWETSKRVVRKLLEEFGGAQMYLPLASSAFKDEDQAAMYDEFDGGNIKELCRKYNMTHKAFYDKIKAERRRRSGRKPISAPQELFGD